MTYKDFPHTVDCMNRFGEQFVSKYKERLISDGNNDGELFKTVRFNVIVNNDSWVIRINLADYWKWAENGRRPGKMPPKEPIDSWIKKKRIVPTMMKLSNGKTVVPTMNQLSFLIRRKIGREGTQGHYYFKNTYEELIEQFKSDLHNAVEEDVKASIKDIL